MGEMDPGGSIMLQDFLLDMDFDEFIPVDNFFGTYVGALEKDGISGVSSRVPKILISQTCIYFFEVKNLDDRSCFLVYLGELQEGELIRCKNVTVHLSRATSCELHWRTRESAFNT
jgi:hypothetical protein